MKKFTPVPSAAFTLIELLVSTTIIALIMLIMVSMTNQTAKTWRATTEKVEKFQGARDGFEAMTRRISQATLNTYWDYVDINGKVRSQFLASFPNDNAALSKFIAASYGRMSELRFVSGPMSQPTSPLVTNNSPPLNPLIDPSRIPDLQKFPTHGIFFQAPLGVVTDDSTSQATYGTNYSSMDNALNTWGYFVETSDYDERPNFISNKITPLRWRCRLMEMRLPSEKMGLYDAFSTDKSNDWFQTWLAIPNGSSPPRPTRVLAENVMALIIWPKLSKQDEDARWNTASASTSQSILCPNYAYSSNPPMDPSTNPQRPYNRNPGVVWNSLASDDVVEKGGVNPINQLPPTVQVTMIAIDERSAKRLAELYGPNSGNSANKYTLGFDLSHRFLTAAHYNRDKGGTYTDMSVTPPTAAFDRTKYESYMDQDIDEYCKEMAAKGVTFRVFSTNVSIRGAKWSRAQF